MPFKTTSADIARDKYKLPEQAKGPKDLKRLKTARQESSLESDFAFAWSLVCPDVPLVREHVFHKTRKYRLDFAHIESQVGIELQGGIWKKGAHSGGTGITRDCQKQWVALTTGWVIFPLVDSMISDSETLLGIAEVIRQRSNNEAI